jgi:hypothetical protein
MTKKPRRIGANQPARKELSQALPRASCFRVGRAVAPSALRPPPFNPAAVLRAALKRADRLGDWDRTVVRRLAARRSQGWSAPERALLVRIADSINLGARDRG